MQLEFVLPIIPPTVTMQEHKISTYKNKVRYYMPPELKDAKEKYLAHLAQHTPEKPLEGPLGVWSAFYFPATKDHPAGTWKTTKPDNDNMIKLLRDCMTKTNFWKDDAQVAMDVVQKRYSETPGIWIKVITLEDERKTDK